jgi:hypothetical protein
MLTLNKQRLVLLAIKAYQKKQVKSREKLGGTDLDYGPVGLSTLAKI